MTGTARFRTRLRDCLSEFTAGATRAWEEAGHLPLSVMAALGRHGVFRERWRDGAAEGAPLVVAMAEETAVVSSGLALAAMAQSEVFCGALHWLAETGSQRSLLDAALEGTAVGCLGSTEPSGGSSLADIHTTACRDEGGWRLRGRKSYISNLGGATHVVVLARLSDRLDTRDLSLFVVPLGAPGVTIDGYFPALGLSACDVGQVSLDVVVDSCALLGQPGMGLAYLSGLLQFERLSICAQLVTGARTALGLAAAFGRRRMVGTERLLDKQAMRHRLARCQSQLWLAEAALADLVRRTESGQSAGHRTAALKLEISQIAEHITDSCLQVFGARGYMRDYPLERIWRDVRLARIGGGSDEVMTELVASRLDRPDPRAERQLEELEANHRALSGPASELPEVSLSGTAAGPWDGPRSH